MAYPCPVMVWPDIPKRLWSYAIGKLKLFTDFDESSLNVQYTSLSLENVQFDVSKLNASTLFTASKCSADRLKLELTSSCLLVSLDGVCLVGSLLALEPPDMVLSMFLSTAFQDFEQFASTETETEQKQVSVLDKITRAAIGQIVVHVTNAVSTLKLKDTDSGVNVHIDSLIWSGNKKLELEIITVTSFAPSEGSGDLLDSHMSRSVCFELDSAESNDICDYELGTVDRIVLDYEIEPFGGELRVENVNIDGFVSLQLAVDLVNALFSQPGSDNGNSGETGSLAVYIDAVTVFDFEGCGSASNLCLQGIQFANNMLLINSFTSDVLSLNPFLRLDFSSTFEVEISTPFNMTVPIERLEAFKQILTKLNKIASQLKLPESDEVAKFTVKLPEIQVQLGELLKMQLFIDSLTETKLEINELVVVSGEGQILAGKSSVLFDNFAISLESLKFMIMPSLLANFDTLKTIFNEPSMSNSVEPFKFNPINASINVKSLFVQYTKFTVTGNLALNSSVKSIDLRSELVISSDLVKGKTALHCCSFPDFTSLVGNIRLSGVELFFPETPFKDEPPEPAEPVSLNVGNFLVNLDFFFEEIKVQFPDSTVIIIDPKNVTVTIGAGKLKTSIRQTSFFLLDKGSKVKLLTIDALRSTLVDAKVETRAKSVCFGCCADSVYKLQQAVASIPTSVKPQEFKIEPDQLIDVFKDIEEEFVASKLEECQTKLAEQVSIQINDEYIWSAPVNRSRVIESGDLEKRFQVKFVIKKFELQLFDGYDLHETRIGMSRAIKTLAEKSKKSKKNSEVETIGAEEAYMNMTLYDSILITPHTTEIDSIKRQIRNEMQGTGVEGFSRSEKPKIRARLQYIKLDQTLFAYGDGSTTIEIRSGEILDEVPTSIYPKLVFRAHGNEADTILFKYTQDTVVVAKTADLKVRLQIEPLRISLDQDTAEFINRFFQFDNSGDLDSSEPQDPEVSESQEPETTNKPFIQRVTLSPLVLTIDYNPKKIDYRILRSGGTAQLLNVFPIKGAKLRLKPLNLYGISGWDKVADEVFKEWMPDIRDNQLADLVTGLSPVRKIVNASKGIRRSQASRFTGVVFKRTMDELDRIKSHFKS